MILLLQLVLILFDKKGVDSVHCFTIVLVYFMIITRNCLQTGINMSSYAPAVGSRQLVLPRIDYSFLLRSEGRAGWGTFIGAFFERVAD